MNKVTDWIKRHQIIAFFIITFAITWGLGFSYGGFYQNGQVLLAPLVFVATCGPALAGIIISAVSNTQPRQGTRKASWIAFFAAWVVAALVCIASLTILNHIALSPALIGFALVSVIPVAFVISMVFSRIPAVRTYLSSLIRLRGVWGWALLGLVFIPGLILLSMLISSLLGRQPIASSQFPDLSLALIGLVIIKFLYQLFFFNATGEETGWRGFALPRLQTRTSPLIASLIIAFFWINWHWFLWQAEGNPMFSWQYWIVQYALHIAVSVIIGWFYNRSKGSILVAGIAHAAANTANGFFPNLDSTVLPLTLVFAALVLIVVDRMWKKLPSDHPAVYQTPVRE
jgi:membrane protease YdiL (CAAX protease family)